MGALRPDSTVEYPCRGKTIQLSPLVYKIAIMITHHIGHTSRLAQDQSSQHSKRSTDACYSCREVVRENVLRDFL